VGGPGFTSGPETGYATCLTFWRFSQSLQANVKIALKFTPLPIKSFPVRIRLKSYLSLKGNTHSRLKMFQFRN
jgi:hypothetical protein